LTAFVLEAITKPFALAFFQGIGWLLISAIVLSMPSALRRKYSWNCVWPAFAIAGINYLVMVFSSAPPHAGASLPLHTTLLLTAGLLLAEFHRNTAFASSHHQATFGVVIIIGIAFLIALPSSFLHPASHLVFGLGTIGIGITLHRLAPTLPGLKRAPVCVLPSFFFLGVSSFLAYVDRLPLLTTLPMHTPTILAGILLGVVSSYLAALCLHVHFNRMTFDGLPSPPPLIGRWIVVVSLALSLAGILSAAHLESRAKNVLEAETRNRAEILSSAVSDRLREDERLAALLVTHPVVTEAISGRGTQACAELLERFSAAIPNSVCLLSDNSGTVISSSNRNEPTSFVGHSYVHPPYIGSALSGKLDTYFALGVTSGVRGHYTSKPLIASDGSLLGVAVIKRDIEFLGDLFHRHAIALLLSPDGIVFFGSRPTWDLKPLFPLPPQRMAELTASRQFGIIASSAIFPTPFNIPGYTNLPMQPAFCLAVPVNPPGWRILVMTDATPLFHARYFPLALILVLLMLVLAFHIGTARIREGSWQVMQVERQFRAIFENAPEGILIIDALTHRILEANPFICRALGAPSTEELQKQTYEKICMNGEADATEFFPRLSGPAFAMVERRFQGPGQPELTAAVTGSCLKLRDRDVYLLFVHDLASRHLLEKMHNESEERFGKLFAAAPNAMLLIRAGDHTIVDANPAALALLGKKREEVIARVCHRFICPSEAGKCPITDLGQQIDNAERILIGPANSRIPILKQVTQLELGGVPHLLESFIDIRHRKGMEQALASAKEVAEAANQEKSRFIAHMSHEIRTPMNALLGLIDVLHAEIRVPRQQHYLELIRHAGESLLALLNDIIDFSRIGAGRMELDETPFDLHALLSNTLELLSGKAAAKHLELVSSIEAAVPRWVVGDQFRLRQILLNLLNNAIKFTERGSVRLSATLPTDEKDGPAVIAFAVRDTGIGIPSDQMAHLFRSYSQVHHGGSAGREGAGLGLAICRHLVHLMGGEIDVISQPGEGSTFRFTIRLRRHRQETVDAIAADDAPPVRTGPAGSILLVEDDEINGKLAETILTQHGWNVTLVTSGSEAARQAAATPFDLLLTDLQVSDTDGLTLTRTIRERERAAGGHLPIIAVTASASPSDRQSCLDAGMDGYLPKPYTPQRLLAVIAATLTSCRNRDDHSILIDTDHLLRRVCGQTDVLRKLISIFLGKYPGMLGELEAATAAQDLDRVSSRAHTLKGTIGTFAAERVFEAVSAVERAARARDAAGVETAMAAFVPLSQAFATELEALAASLDGTGPDSQDFKEPTR